MPEPDSPEAFFAAIGSCADSPFIAWDSERVIELIRARDAAIATRARADGLREALEVVISKHYGSDMHRTILNRIRQIEAGEVGTDGED